MPHTILPSIHLTITPHFEDSTRGQDVSYLMLHMTIECPNLKTNDALLTLPMLLGNVPSQDYGASLNAFDDAGPLSLRVHDFVPEGRKLQREWLVERPTNGKVTLEYCAKPRHVDAKTAPGPRVDLRKDQGGIHGAGASFVPVPPTPEKEYRVSMSWDLCHAPVGTRAVWTFGEGSGPIERIGPASILSNTIYAVGPLHSFPPVGEGNENDYGYYWFGDAPNIVVKQGKSIEEVFRKMSTFFNDPPSPSNPYRVLVRRATPARGVGGEGFLRSFMFEYDSSVGNDAEDQLFSLFCHELVHNWPRLGYEADCDDDGSDPSTNWYSEGPLLILFPGKWDAPLKTDLTE